MKDIIYDFLGLPLDQLSLRSKIILKDVLHFWFFFNNSNLFILAPQPVKLDIKRTKIQNDSD